VPTEEECEYVLKVADASDKVINGFVNRNEIEVAVQIWKNHLSNKQDIEETFAKYDINHDNKLEHEELKALLTDLNDGHPVSDEEVKAVMNEADGCHGAVEKTGGINKTELMGKTTQHTRCCMFLCCDARVSSRNLCWQAFLLKYCVHYGMREFTLMIIRVEYKTTLLAVRPARRGVGQYLYFCTTSKASVFVLFY
jgi:hypothetical protein